MHPILKPDDGGSKNCRCRRFVQTSRFFLFFRRENSYGLSSMQTSARNCFSGKVVALKKGPILAELELAIGPETSLVSHIAFTSVTELGLAVGSSIYALVKASQVILLTDASSVRLSTQNCFCGTVSTLRPGAVNTEVIIQIEDNLSLVAIVTHESATELDLRVGSRVCAAFAPSSVLIAIET